MSFLLDVNVLIALIDVGHDFHLRAHNWFATVSEQGWATYPITENAVLRIVGNSRYPNSTGTPAGVLANMATLRARPGHEFWPDSVSFSDTAYIEQTRLLYSSQLTDSYLLALAIASGDRCRDWRSAGASSDPVTSAVLHPLYNPPIRA